MTYLRDPWFLSLIALLVGFLLLLFLGPAALQCSLERVSTPVVAALLAAIAYRLFTRADSREHSNVAYLNAWRAVILELWNALERMRDLAEYSIEHPDQTRFFQIRLVTGIGAAYFQLQGHLDSAKTVYVIYNDIEHFQDSHRRAIEYLQLAKSATDADQRQRYVNLNKMWIDRGAVWVARHRHHGMTDNLLALIAEYNAYCRDCGLKRLSIKGIEPRKLLPKYWENG